ncbi:tetratricopeptide repeat protein [Crateriforma spongiae]|uniref:tetratricopeptide repeat protein n=1 Tax=Crateriforma spongiae TaxID=2724528 RepID=UPI0039AFCFF4
MFRDVRACLMVTLLGGLVCVAAPAVAQEAGTQDDTGAQANDSGQADDGAIQIDPLPSLDTAQDPGQADLDEAVSKRIDAKTAAELESVAALLESALSKGLGDENSRFAKQMLGSVQLQLGQGLFGAMMRGAGGNAAAVRLEALELLKKAVENDDQLADAHVLIAQLNSPAVFPDADGALAVRSITKAIKLYEDDPKKQSTMLAMRAGLRDDPEKQIRDLNRALKLDPKNTKAFQARIVLRLGDGQIDKAVADVREILDDQPMNLAIVAAAVEQLMDADRDDEAVELLTEAIEKQASDNDILERLYRIRSRVHTKRLDQESAIADLNKSIELRPGDPRKLIELAQRCLENEDVTSAKGYVQDAINLNPRVADLPETILVQFLIASQEKRIPDAINEVKKLIDFQKDDPQRQAFWQEQLGQLYMVDDRPRQAIDVFEQILEIQPENTNALRSRGDALLAIGEHQTAIRDYEDALKILQTSDTGPAEKLKSTDMVAPDYAGLMNNLAWVLATSPKDDVRDGQRALELARQAARLTDYQKPHILSTLAAAHAESGDIPKAIEYSQAAVDLGAAQENDQLEQLQEELDSYRAGEPWREKQETEENEKPILSAEDLIDI